VNIDFPGKTVIVTGAVRGIGRGIASAFAERGAQVYACDVLAGDIEEQSAEAAPEAGGALHSRITDVTDTASVQALVTEAESHNGQVDVLVHAAGGVLGQSRAPIEQVSDEDWRAILAVNVDGAFRCVRAVAPGMKRAGAGRVVIISSGAGLGVSLTGIAAYGTAKTAQVGMVRQLAAELGPFGITVNSVAPGFMRTSPDYERQWNGYDAQQQQAVFQRIAIGRWGTPEDIAHAVLFFASDFASWITGQTLAVKGAP